MSQEYTAFIMRYTVYPKGTHLGLCACIESQWRAFIVHLYMSIRILFYVGINNFTCFIYI